MRDLPLSQSPRLALLLLVSLATTAHAAAPNAPGVNLRWDQCYADGGLMYKSFACDTNTGSERLVMSFELAAEKANMSGFEMVLSLESASASLPAWWQLRNVGTCRQSATSFTTALPPGSVQCTDWGSGQSVGGIGNYVIGGHGPNYALFACAIAVPAAYLATVQPGVEYNIGSIVIQHAKTVGTGACAGCDVPVCLSFDYGKLTTPSAAEDLLLTHGANYEGSRLVSWQNGLVTNYQAASRSPSNGLLYPAYYDCVPYSTTPARPSTWGAVKSLYR